MKIYNKKNLGRCSPTSAVVGSAPGRHHRVCTQGAAWRRCGQGPQPAPWPRWPEPPQPCSRACLPLFYLELESHEKITFGFCFSCSFVWFVFFGGGRSSIHSERRRNSRGKPPKPPNFQDNWCFLMESSNPAETRAGAGRMTFTLAVVVAAVVALAALACPWCAAAPRAAPSYSSPTWTTA